MKPLGGSRKLSVFGITSLILAIFVAGCGDERIVSINAPGSLQGVWEGTISLSSTVGGLRQTSRMRLELIQRDFSFEGFLLKIDPLAEGFGRAPVDTFLVIDGSVSANFISFKTLDPGGGTAMFQGEKTGKTLTGTALGTDYSGDWTAEFVF